MLYGALVIGRCAIEYKQGLVVQVIDAVYVCQSILAGFEWLKT